jgi:GNAT superfamily N-acetyltransferase
MYIKEKAGLELIEWEHAWASFGIFGEKCVINDLWVHPEHRRCRLAFSLADHISGIAKDKGSKYLCASVVKNADFVEQSLAVQLAYGFQKINEDEIKIYLMKEI